jgi:hypothetical protein
VRRLESDYGRANSGRRSHGTLISFAAPDRAGETLAIDPA